MNLNRIPKKIIIIIFALVFFFFFLFLFVSPFDFNKNIKKSVGIFGRKSIFPVAINGEKINSKGFKIQNEDIVVLSDTSLSCFSENQNRNFSKPHGFSSPRFKCSKNRILIYDQFGDNFKINKVSEEILNAKLKDTIISGDISDSGNYVFAISAKESLNQILVFSDNFKEIFKYSLQDYYVNGVCIDKIGKMIAISGVSSSFGKLKSIIYIFDIEKESPKAKFEYDDVMFFEIGFFENENVVAIGDNLTTVIKDFSEKISFSHNKKPITCFDITSKGAVLSLSSKSDFNDCNLISINNKGDFSEPIKTNSNINVVSYNDDIISALSSSKIFICENNKISKTIFLENDVKSISLAPSKNLYLLGISNINLLDF